MDSPRGLSSRIRQWRAQVGSAIAGRPAGHYSGLASASEPLMVPEERAPPQAEPYSAASPASGRRADSLLAVAAAAGAPVRRGATTGASASQYALGNGGGVRRGVLPAAAASGGGGDAAAELALWSTAARTAAALGWDVCAAAAPEERDVLLGDDLRVVAEQLRGCLAAAVQGGAPEVALADAFDALDELGYVMDEFERPTVPYTPAPPPETAPRLPVPALPPPPSMPPPPAPAAPVPAAPDTEKPLIDL